MADTGNQQVPEELLPLVDATILEDLEDEVNGSELVLRFARDYAAMWDKRYSRLALAVQNQDRASALDAIISLKITSTMVGGLRLARLAELLESVIRQGDFGQGQAMMERVADNGDRTVSELQANYILKSE
jgi:HPt (histidine-containing phosphotransfer) domain-containing protein